jgi:hypothetical protein
MSKGCFFFFWHNGWPYKSLQKLVWKICWANSWFLLFLTIDLFRILISPLGRFLVLEKKNKKKMLILSRFFQSTIVFIFRDSRSIYGRLFNFHGKKNTWFIILYINLYMFLSITIKTWVIYLLRHVVFIRYKHWFFHCAWEEKIF